MGRGAPAEFLQQLEALATSHHEAMGLDVIRAYHFGARCGRRPAAPALVGCAPPGERAAAQLTSGAVWCLGARPLRYIVELEVLLPPGMTVRESHDISLELQHKVRGRACARARRSRACSASQRPPGRRRRPKITTD